MSSCGACTLCCTLVPVGATGKRSFTRCEYQRDPPAQAIGCAIHATRPASCAAWACQFLREDWPAEFRPDRTGVVFDTVPDLVTINGREVPCVQAWVRPGVDEQSFGRQPLLAVVMAATEIGGAVLFRMTEGTVAVFRQEGELAWVRSSGRGSTAEPEYVRLRRARVLERSYR
jgi:hypothetical protein